MKIAFDAKRLFNNLSGLGVYSRSLVKALLEFMPENEYSLKVHTKHFSNSPFLTDAFKEHASISNALIAGYWRTFELGKEVDEENFEVYHGLSNELPKGGLNKVKKVVTIHDLIAYKHPEWFSLADAKILKAKVNHAIKNSDRIIVPSNFVKRDIQTHFSSAVDKTHVVQEAIEKTDLAPSKTPFTQFDEEPEDFFLFVGNTNPRKNFSLVLAAMMLIQDVTLIAVLTSSKPDAELKKLMQKLIEQKRLIVLEYVSPAELNFLYENSKGLLYPSIEEGFGLPVLEAMQNKCAIITTNNSSMSEVASDAAIYLASNEAEELKLAMLQLMDPTISIPLVKLAEIRAKEFTLERMATETHDVYLS